MVLKDFHCIQIIGRGLRKKNENKKGLKLELRKGRGATLEYPFYIIEEFYLFLKK
jgi:hypothetical protein